MRRECSSAFAKAGSNQTTLLASGKLDFMDKEMQATFSVWKQGFLAFGGVLPLFGRMPASAAMLPGIYPLWGHYLGEIVARITESK